LLLTVDPRAGFFKPGREILKSQSYSDGESWQRKAKEREKGLKGEI